MKQIKFMFFLLIAFAFSAVAPQVQADVGCDQQTELYAQVVNNTAPQAEAPKAVQNPEAPTPVVAVSDTSESVLTVKKDIPEPPPAGSPWYYYVEWIIGTITASAFILRILVRWIKTSGNVDQIKKGFEVIKIVLTYGIDLIEWLLGGFVENRNKDGGVHEEGSQLTGKA